MKEKQNIPNWAVEAVDPPPGVSSFCTLNTQRDIRVQRRNPQFENEPHPMSPTAAIAKRSESSSRSTASGSTQSPVKLKKGKDLKGDGKPETTKS